MIDFLYSEKYSVFMAKKKGIMGRPPLKEKDRRTAIITLRLKKSERKKLERDAKAKRLSLSTYLLKCWKKAR